MNIALLIPARYGSTRFPGKPLAKIAGKTMLGRVVEIAKKCADKNGNIAAAVATEDERIANHCKEIDIPCVMTSDTCKTGSDRILEAAEKLGDFDYIIGLQGDAPFTPLEAPEKMIEAFQNNPGHEVVTPIVRLRWEELEALHEQKKQTPFSGTTVTIDTSGKALWFSKTILPAIRNTENLQKEDAIFSPVYQHIGLYGYRMDTLKRFVSLSQGHYEQLEGLEQLRLLENNISVQTVLLDVPAGLAQAGIDSPEDIERAERILAEQEAAA